MPPGQGLSFLNLLCEINKPRTAFTEPTACKTSELLLICTSRDTQMSQIPPSVIFQFRREKNPGTLNDEYKIISD